MRTLFFLLLLLGMTSPVLADEKDEETPMSFPRCDFDRKESFSKARGRATSWLKLRIDEGHPPEVLLRHLDRKLNRYIDERRKEELEKLTSNPTQREKVMSRFEKDARALRESIEEQVRSLHASKQEASAKEEERRIRREATELGRGFRQAIDYAARRRDAAAKGEMSSHLLARLRESGLDDTQIEERRKKLREERQKRHAVFADAMDRRRKETQDLIARGSTGSQLRSRYMKREPGHTEPEKDRAAELRRRGYSPEEIRDIQQFSDK